MKKISNQLYSTYVGGEVRGEMGARSRMCCVGWVVWVHGFCYYRVGQNNLPKF